MPPPKNYPVGSDLPVLKFLEGRHQTILPLADSMMKEVVMTGLKRLSPRKDWVVGWFEDERGEPLIYVFQTTQRIGIYLASDISREAGRFYHLRCPMGRRCARW